MSAWIVSKGHIDALVWALGVREGFPDGASPDEVGTILWAENHRSVNYRYDESEPTPPYVYTLPPVRWTPGQVLRLLECYDYQACESPDWKTTPAYQLTTTLREALANEGVAKSTDAPWGLPECGANEEGYEHDETCTDCERVIRAIGAAMPEGSSYVTAVHWFDEQAAS